VIWTVAVDAPLPPLSYEIPEAWNPERGQSVIVPLGSRRVHGLLLNPASDAHSTNSSATKFTIKRAVSPAADRPRLEEARLQWLEWLAKYYIHSLGETAELSFPPLAKSGGRRKSKKSALINANSIQSAGNAPAFELNPAQREAARAISDAEGFHAHLLFGVTGSGKTEVYLECIQRQLALGRQALVLVPEIALTPQLIDRFAARLGERIAVIHSHLTPREKTDNWWRAQSAEADVLIGARSALFCPMPNLGLIIIDEEHEASFKQDESLRYHARDAAIVLAQKLKVPIVLGSATPSLETWHNALSGKYQRHDLPARATNASMPEIHVIDLRSQREKEKIAGRRDNDRPFWISKELQFALTDTLERGEQAALFLNRRGIAQSVFCPACGTKAECPNCAVSLTLHGRSHLVCHYCDYHETKKEICGECKEGEPQPLGLGTELLENDLRSLFPAARLARMDRDEIRSREDLEAAIRGVEQREVDVLIGTQMIAKGLDFPGLTLVGLVMADVAFNLPDFRASERAFQLLTQVAGRSGRHLEGRRGQVFIQTYNPTHAAIRFTLAHDYEGFAREELSFRSDLNYPPAQRLVALRFAGPDADETLSTASRVGSLARQLIEIAPFAGRGLDVLGPAASPLAKLRNQFRFQMFIKGQDAPALARTLSEAIDKNRKKLPPKVKIHIDVDAHHLL